MTDLITKEEVIALAFQRPINTMKIPDGLIAAIQRTHIRPILGKNFYLVVLANPDSYEVVVDLIKPILALFTKFYVLPEIYNDISNSGINKIPGINRAAGTVEDLGSARQIALDQANLACQELSEFLKDNASTYPLYIWQQDPNQTIDISGGIISRIDTNLEDDDR
jgi:hypothetical protein